MKNCRKSNQKIKSEAYRKLQLVKEDDIKTKHLPPF